MYEGRRSIWKCVSRIIHRRTCSGPTILPMWPHVGSKSLCYCCAVVRLQPKMSEQTTHVFRVFKMSINVRTVLLTLMTILYLYVVGHSGTTRPHPIAGPTTRSYCTYTSNVSNWYLVATSRSAGAIHFPTPTFLVPW